MKKLVILSVVFVLASMFIASTSMGKEADIKEFRSARDVSVARIVTYAQLPFNFTIPSDTIVVHLRARLINGRDGCKLLLKENTTTVASLAVVKNGNIWGANYLVLLPSTHDYVLSFKQENCVAPGMIDKIGDLWRINDQYVSQITIPENTEGIFKLHLRQDPR